MKKFKKIKLRVPRIPENAKIMSLLAIILVCAAPALVSVIDEKATFDTTYEKDIQAIPTGIEARLSWSADTPESTDKTFAILVEDNVITVALTTPASKAYVSSLTIYGFDPAIINGLVKLSLISDIEAKPLMTTMIGDVYKQFSFEAIDGVDGGYSYTPSSYDRVLIGGGDSTDLVFKYFGAALQESSIYTVSVVAEYGTAIHYGEIIVGATGALLLICALFATPFFGLGGYTGPKSKRRGA